MADIKPFVCVRPAEDVVSAVAALPYDVYNREEAKEVVAKNPKSFLAIDRAETQFPDDVDTYDDRVYAKAAQMLKDWIADGTFIRDNRECYYIYDKEQDRIRHVDTCSAQTGPIFLAYRANAVINEVVAKTKKQDALYDFVAEDGIRHRVFVISDPEDIQTIRNAFAQIGEIYIADGHHRAASAVKVGFKRREEHPGYTGKEEFNYFLSVLFPDEELMIMDYNRVVRDLGGMTEEAFLSKMQELFDVQKIENGNDVRPVKKGQFSMFLSDKWYRCTMRPESVPEDPVEGLDVSVLQNVLLAPVLGIGDPKTDKRIDFVGGIRGMKELERRCHEDCQVAFAMYPTSIQELFAVADAGRLMPPKSTWFEPKLRSGLFIHEI